jgi:predicted CopG family antitoxin
MKNITLSIPDEIYRKMKEYKEVKWSEVVRRAIVDYIKRLEEGGFEITTDKLLDELGGEFEKNLKELSLERAVKGYKRMRDAEWKRLSTTRAS